MPTLKLFIVLLLVLLYCAKVAGAPAGVLARNDKSSLKANKQLVSRAQHALPFGSIRGLTYLEQRAVRSPTITDYTRRIREFLAFCHLRQLTWHTSLELDLVICQRIEELFFNGKSMEEGTHLVAAVKFFLAEVSRLGESGLPRCMKALKGWGLAAPGLQRLPLPLEVLGAILGIIVMLRLPQVALRLFLMFITYLRPGESALKVWQLVKPQSEAISSLTWAILLHPVEGGVPGKTNLFDGTILIDQDLWIGDFLLALIRGRGGQEELWSHSHDTLIATFKRSLLVLNLEFLGATLYSLRHGGASFDLLQRRRSLLEIKRRGRWAADSSLKRYAKEARLQHQLSLVPLPVRRFGLQVLAQLPGILAGVVPVPPSAFTP